MTKIKGRAKVIRKNELNFIQLEEGYSLLAVKNGNDFALLILKINASDILKAGNVNAVFVSRTGVKKSYGKVNEVLCELLDD